MNTLSKLFLGLAITCAAIPGYSKTYYVSPASNASDSNSGTQSSPWASIIKAASTAKAGDTVLFEDGVYNVNNRVQFRTKGTKSAPITFKSINKHGAQLRRGLSSGNGDAFLSIGVYGTGGWQENQEMFLVFDGLDLSGGSRHTIQSAGGGQLIIKNNLIHGSGNDPIKINSGANDVTIENNEIYNSGLNESQDCSKTHTCNSDGIDVTSSDNLIVRNNHIHDIASWGLYTKKGSKNSIIENNLIHDVYEGGIGLGESTVTYNAIARNNILYNISESCLQFAGAKDSKFYNNTCYNVSTFGGGNWAGMRVAPASHTAGANPGDDKYSRNIEFYNNIIVINNSYGVCLKTSDPSFNGGSKTANIAQFKMDNNICYNLQSGVPYKWIFENKVSTGIDSWRAYTASLGNPLSKNDKIGNPKLLNVSDKYSSDFFMLDSTSLAKDSGKDVIADVAMDYFSTPRQGLNFDMGATENVSNAMSRPTNLRVIKN